MIKKIINMLIDITITSIYIKIISAFAEIDLFSLYVGSSIIFIWIVLDIIRERKDE